FVFRPAAVFDHEVENDREDQNGEEKSDARQNEVKLIHVVGNRRSCGRLKRNQGCHGRQRIESRLYEAHHHSSAGILWKLGACFMLFFPEANNARRGKARSERFRPPESSEAPRVESPAKRAGRISRCGGRSDSRRAKPDRLGSRFSPRTPRRARGASRAPDT